MKSVCDAKGWKYSISARIDNDKIKDYRYPIIFKSQTSKVLINQHFKSLTFDNKLLEEDTGHFRKSQRLDFSISSKWEQLDSVIFAMLEKDSTKDLLKWHDFVADKPVNSLSLDEKIASYECAMLAPRLIYPDYLEKYKIPVVKLKGSSAYVWDGEIKQEDDCKYCFAITPNDMRQYTRVFLYDMEKWMLTYYYRKRFVVTRPKNHEHLTFKDREIIDDLIKKHGAII
jgi:hypothetical protein